jgi:hypothetical protein
MFEFLHALAIVVLSVSSFGIGYTIAKDNTVPVLKKDK